MKCLVLIDGNAILHRAYHALPRLTNKKGEVVNAVYGFCSMLLKIFADLKPDFLAVAFDRPEPTFRHQEFIGYQAQRPKTEEDLSFQMDKLKEVLKRIGVVIFEKPGYEADDVIGTIAKKALKLETIIVSGDKDLMQLVNKSTKLYLPIRGLSGAELVDAKGVREKLEIKPNQVVDYKALVGDPSDNYPGVPGIGPKTAVGLLEKFGTLDNIYKDTSDTEISPNVVKKLREGYESAMLSRKLAAIVTDVPIKLKLEKLEVDKLESEKMIELLEELGFKSLVGRLVASRSSVKPPTHRKKSQLKLFPI